MTGEISKLLIREKKRAKRRETISGIGFILPSFLGFLVFVLIPVIISLILSFTQWNFLEGINAIRFTGLDNYKKLLSDDWFRVSYVNNFVFTLVTVPIQAALGLILAAIINKYIYCVNAVKIMMFIPNIASVVAVCTVWMVLLQPSYGPINQFLMAIGIENPPGWLTSFQWALPSVMVVYIWQNIGYYIVVFTAGLKNIPAEIYEAADIDGASVIRKFFSITVPMVSPTTFFLVTMGIIASFKVFDNISVLTEGGPGNATSVMAYYIYKTAFIEYKTGYSNTLAWALFVIIFIVTVIQSKMQSRFTNE